MLVLSRKATEEIIFPALGVSIRVMRVGGNTVKLGIHAPKSLKIVRGELMDCSELIDTLRHIGKRIEHHDLRGQLNSAVLNLEVLTAAQEKGMPIDDQAILGNVINQLGGLENILSQQARPVAAASEVTDGCPNVLVVDDNQNERELLKSVLSIHGFEVETASDGDEALRHLSERNLPDAVLLDMHMPRLSGEKTLRCIRTDFRMSKLRVIGVSGNQPDALVLPDGLPGFDAWFDKPLDLGRLVELIRKSSDTFSSAI